MTAILSSRLGVLKFIGAFAVLHTGATYLGNVYIKLISDHEQQGYNNDHNGLP
jgi:hypothetical protein